MTSDEELRSALDVLRTIDRAIGIAPVGSLERRELEKARRQIDLELGEEPEVASALKIAMLEADIGDELVHQAREDLSAEQEYERDTPAKASSDVTGRVVSPAAACRRTGASAQ